MKFETEILIVGGGLAGIAAALHLQKFGLNVILIEKNSYPHHKVCGEYISNEVLPYLKWLDVDLDELNPAHISSLHFTTLSGGSIVAQLPLGGFGISRFTLDNYLFTKFKHRGGEVIFDTVSNIIFADDRFEVQTLSGKQLFARQVIGAFGKRSTLDTKLSRNFIKAQSPYLAVKSHYKGSFPSDLVALHNFRGGYCGVSKVENDKINICYLADYESFKRYKNIQDYQQNVLYKNHFLKTIFEHAEMDFESPLTIGQISFTTKEAVWNHILLIGDAAALIHPLCGNGMAMAIHSAKVASELLLRFMLEKNFSRKDLESSYSRIWKLNFSSRLRTGTVLSSILKNNFLQGVALHTLIKVPGLLTGIIKSTHGKPITTPT